MGEYVKKVYKFIVFLLKVSNTKNFNANIKSVYKKCPLR